jgi:hypothetical protein
MSDLDQDLGICVKCSQRSGTTLWRGVLVCSECLARLEQARHQKRSLAGSIFHQDGLYILSGLFLAIVLLSMIWLLLGWAPAALLTLGVTGVALILWQAKQYE